MTVAQLLDALANMPPNRRVEAETADCLDTVFAVRLSEDYYDNLSPGDTPECSVVLVTQPSWNGAAG